jgi:ATP-dependent DNA helicase RecQ
MRRRLARRARIKPYQVFPDKTLKAIVEARPASLETLGALWGMGDKRLTRYGSEILRLVAASPPPCPTSAR